MGATVATIILRGEFHHEPFEALKKLLKAAIVGLLGKIVIIRV
jgi:hypothetical protein